MTDERLRQIETWHSYGEPVGKDVEAELIAEVRRLREALERTTGAIDLVRHDLGTQYPALSEVYVMARAILKG